MPAWRTSRPERMSVPPQAAGWMNLASTLRNSAIWAGSLIQRWADARKRAVGLVLRSEAYLVLLGFIAATFDGTDFFDCQKAPAQGLILSVLFPKCQGSASLA